MNKQEAIEKLKEKSWESEDVYVGDITVIDLDDAQEIVSKIDEPQKVAVPKFVGDWLKKYQYAHTLLRALNAVENEQVVPSKVNDWILDNQYDFIKAWIDGWDIAKEEEKDETE